MNQTKVCSNCLACALEEVNWRKRTQVFYWRHHGSFLRTLDLSSFCLRSADRHPARLLPSNLIYQSGNCFEKLSSLAKNFHDLLREGQSTSQCDRFTFTHLGRK